MIRLSERTATSPGVIGAAPPALDERVQLTSPVLVGRDAELRALVHAALASRGLTIVHGEAGVGKSRLIAEMLDDPALRGRVRVVGRCRPLREPFVLEPVVDALRSIERDSVATPLDPVTGVLRPLLPELAALLPQPPAGTDDPLAQRQLLFRAVVELLRALGPAVCVLEDVQWADEHTTEFLRFAEKHIPKTLSLIISFRREEMTPTSPLAALGNRMHAGARATRIAVEPLPAAKVRALVAALLGTDTMSDDFAAFMYARTEGVPFAVEEVLRLVVERRELILHRGRWIRRSIEGLTVPASISDSVSERIARLESDARRLVEAAAVIAAPASPELLRAVAELRDERVARAIDDAVGAAILVQDRAGRCSFRHALANQAVYQGTPAALRRQLHGRVAAELELQRPRPLADLAHHHHLAGNREQWVAAADAAADLALSVHDDASAVHLLRGVVDEAPLSGDDLSRLAIKLAQAMVRGLHPRSDVIAVLQRVLSDGGLPDPVRGELRYLVGIMLVTAGDGSAGHRQWEIAVSELGARPELAITVMTHLAYLWVPDGTADEHLRWLDRAVRKARRYDDDLVRLSVVCTQAETLLGLGDPKGWDALERIPASATSPEAQRVLVWAWLEIANIATQIGHFERAWALLDTATQVAEANSYRSALGAADVCSICLRWATGAWEGLEAEAERVIDAFADNHLWSLTASAITGYLASARGEPEQAEEIFRRCLEDSEASGPAIYALAAAELARLRLARNQPEAAWEMASRGIAALEAKQIWAWSHWVAPAAVETLVLLRRVEEANRFVQRIAHGLRGRSAPWSEAALAFCRGLVSEARGRHRDAARWYADAAQRHTALPNPYEAARSREREGLAQLGIDDRRGEDGLREAVARFVELGATDDVHRVRRELRKHNVAAPNPWRGGRAGYGNRLSPREEAVARLAARGRTNAQIAQEMFLSPRTVEHHMGACMRKLKVRSRMELAQLINSYEGLGSGVAPRRG